VYLVTPKNVQIPKACGSLGFLL